MAYPPLLLAARRFEESRVGPSDRAEDYQDHLCTIATQDRAESQYLREDSMKQNTLCFVVAVLAVAVGSVVALSAVYMRIVGDKSLFHSLTSTNRF